LISITIPVFNEKANLPDLYAELHRIVPALNRPCEIIFINDGSSDGSAEILDAFAAGDPSVTVLHFRRNFGQTAAMMAGFDHSRGDIIVPMDGDGQNDPADIPLLLQSIEDGADLCSGWRRERRDPWHRRLASRAANRLISWVTRVHLHDFGCTLKAYRKEAISGVKLYGEMHRFLPIHAAWQGARLAERVVHHRPRHHGQSNYGMERTLKVLLDLLVVAFIDRFLSKPIYLFGSLGLFGYLLSFLAFAASIYFKFWGGKSFIETPLPLFSAMCFLTGTILFLMGILAELLMRTYYESQNKATYVIQRASGPATKSSQPSPEKTGSKTAQKGM
jgi:glycosyltransferase involved in cell wall biosynthesis